MRENSVNSGRLHQLDGLRGVAALIVVVFHYFAAFAPWLTPDQHKSPSFVADSPIAVFFNGPFSVIVFFVLSGFVVSRSVRSPKASFISLVIIRYGRLTIPAIASVVLAKCLLTLAPNAASDLADLTGANWLSYTYNGAIPSIFRALYESSIDIYLHNGSNFNNVLWTMKAELIGSVLIYMIYVVVPRRYRIPALLGFAILLPIVTQRSNFAAFGLGALLQEAWSDRRLPFVMPSLLLIVGLLIGSQGTGFSERVGLTFLPEQLKLGNKVGMLYPIGATLIVYACLVSERLAQALSSSSCRFLGRISFGLYLVHVPLLMTVFASVALMLEPLSPAVIALGLPVVLAAAVAAGWLMTIAVDEPLLRMLARLRSRSRTEDALQGRSSGLTVQEPVGDRATKAALDQATSHLEAIRFFDKLLASKRSHRPQRQ